MKLAERFVEDWIEDNVKKAPNLSKNPGVVERLALKLENDAWEFGMLRKAYLEAVNGDSHMLVLSEVEKASDPAS